MLHEIVAGFAVYFDSLQRANPRFSQVALRADAVTSLCLVEQTDPLHPLPTGQNIQRGFG